MKRFYILFIGQVQGVGFRWVLTTLANKYSVVGYCRNLENGNVECEIQGNQDNLDTFLKEVFEHQGYIRIDDHYIKEIKTNDDRSFSVKY